MNLHVIHTGNFKLDGGAMFGVVPKTLWERTNPADSNNLCTWAMRCLLIEEDDRVILVDTGIGEKQSEKFFSHYYLHGDHDLLGSLRQAGFERKDITDVFHTHLHFDHCGGGVMKDSTLTFPHATYWSDQDHWTWATQPNSREKASFLKENILPIQESGQLKMVQGDTFDSLFKIIRVNGHTESQMLPVINYKGRTVVFVADLLPSVGHIPLPYVMGYDTRPLLTLQEKESFLNDAVKYEYVLYLEHDPVNECCTVRQTEKGIRLDKTFCLSDL